MKNRIRSIIKKQGYKNPREFALKNGITPQRVNYWMQSKKQTKSLTESVERYLGVDKYIY